MNKSLFVTLVIFILVVFLASCNVTSPPSLPNDTPNASFTPTPPDEFAPPIDDDDYDVVIGGGDTGETNPPEENPPEENPPEENPPEENPPEENPPAENPPEENPPEDNPPEDNPPEDNPPVENPPEENPPEDNPPEDNPPVVDPPVVDPSLGDVPSSSQVASGFVVKQKKYDHGSNNLIVLNVTNNNSENYVVTITGYYLDANGNVLKTETQTVNGYVANYEKYFSFIPEIAFDQFVFTLTAEKYSGECLDQLFSLTELWIEHRTQNTPWGEVQNSLFLRGHIWGRLDNKYCAKTKFIIIDSSGKVYSIKTKTYENKANTDVPDNTIFLLNRTTGKDQDAWLPELKDGYSIIVTHYIAIAEPIE